MRIRALVGILFGVMLLVGQFGCSTTEKEAAPAEKKVEVKAEKGEKKAPAKAEAKKAEKKSPAKKK